VPHIALDAARPRCRADHAECNAIVECNRADFFKPRLHGRRVPEQFRGPRHITEGGVQPFEKARFVGVIEIEADAAGSHQTAPERLPHSAAVRLRKSPRSRPQNEAVGR